MIEKKFTKNDFEIVQRDDLYQGIFHLTRYHLRHQLFKGNWSDVFTRECLERLSAAAVLPYDPKLDRVILIEQFRIGSAIAHPSSPWLVEIPAGVLHQDETPEQIARQEAVEEAGCHILELKPICEYYVSPGGSNEYLSLFCGKIDANNINGIFGLENENEDIRVINVSVDEALKKLKEGEIKTSPAIISLLWLQLNRAQLRNW